MTVAPGTLVDHFSVLRRIGAGGMADVWLARDTRLGRKVALKLIRADVLETEADRARFLNEARVTARFSHPHIVTIYAVGEVQGRAYLALEYLEGSTLRSRVGAAPREVVRWGMAIADALTEAHGQGLMHRDLKPENVVLARDGRLRVLDFGLARAEADPRGAEGGLVRGTPAYMAPELWLGHRPTPAVDVWALGALLYEMIQGRCPFCADDPYALAERITDPATAVPSMPDEPPGLAAIITECLDRNPAGRPSAMELVDRLAALIGGSPLESSPFRGLHAFDESHAAIFFGRDAEISAFLERMRTDAFLAVLGPSGAGKSSFVQAGVIPRLRERGPITTITVRPGRTPLATLAAQLGAASPLDAAALRETPGLLADGLYRLAQQDQSSVVLVVDQLEEVVTLTEDDAVRNAFIDAIVGAADDPLSPVRVVVTLREEFLGRVAVSEKSRDAFSRITVLRSPGPEALREIVTRPVEAVGHAYDDPTLPDDMVAEVVDEAAGLPLLQFAGQQLWLRRDREGRLLRRSDYAAIGGVAGALARHADGVLASMSNAQVDHARAMLLRLVTDEGTRQILSRDEVLYGLPVAAAEVLDALIDARLLVAREAQLDSDESVVIEIVHESLTRSWGRLARWIDDNHDDLAFLTEVRQAAQVWARRGRPMEEVWSDTGLAEALRRADKLDTVPVEVAEFLNAGRGRDRRRRRRRRLVVGTLIVATIAVVVVLTWQRQLAVDQRAAALAEQARALRSEAQAALDADEGQLARAAARAALEIRDELSSRAVWWRSSRLPMRWERHFGEHPRAIAWRADGEQLAVRANDVVTLHDAATGRVQRTLADVEPKIIDNLHFTPDGSRLLGWSTPPMLTVWDTTTGGVTKLRVLAEGPSLEPMPDPIELTEDRLDGKLVYVDASTDAVFGRRITIAAGTLPDHELVVAVRAGEGIRVLDVDSRDVVWDWPTPSSSCEPRRVGPTGLLVTCDGKQVLHWLAPGGEGHRRFRYPSAVTAQVVARHADVLVTGHRDGSVEVRHLGSAGAARAWHSASTGRPWVEVSDDGTGVWAASPDGSLAEWDARDGSQTWRIEAHERPLSMLAHHRGHLATSDRSGQLRVWDPARTPAADPERGLNQAVRAAAFSPRGDTVATAGRDGEIRLWSTATGALQRRLVTGADETRGLDISPDGRWLASSHDDATARIWDLETGALHTRIAADTRNVRFDPSSTRLATSGRIDGVRLWRVPSGAPDRDLEWVEETLYGSAWSPDGRWLAGSSVGLWAGVWDTQTGALGHSWDDFHRYGFWQVSFTTQGSLLIDDQAGAWRCDPQTGSCTEATAPEHGSWWVGGEEQPWRFSAGDLLTRWDPDDGAVLRRPLATPPGPAPQAWSDRRGVQLLINAQEPYVRLFDQDLHPVWATRAVLDAGLRTWTQRGWEPDPPVDAERLAPDTHFAAQTEGGPLCRWTRAAELEVWPPGASVPHRHEVPGIAELVAHPEGCAARDGEGLVTFFRTDGAFDPVADGATGLGVAADRLVVLEPDAVLLIAPGGPSVDERAAQRPTAAAPCGPSLCVGDTSGTVRVLGAGPLQLSDTPSSRVVSLADGPGGTVLAGFANGVVGAWDPTNGQHLLSVHLHGPVQHIRVEGTTALAATVIGDVERLDLSALSDPYCELLRDVWRQVPIVPGADGLERRAPDPRHPCAE